MAYYHEKCIHNEVKTLLGLSIQEIEWQTRYFHFEYPHIAINMATMIAI